MVYHLCDPRQAIEPQDTCFLVWTVRAVRPEIFGVDEIKWNRASRMPTARGMWPVLETTLVAGIITAAIIHSTW